MQPFSREQLSARKKLLALHSSNAFPCKWILCRSSSPPTCSMDSRHACHKRSCSASKGEASPKWALHQRGVTPISNHFKEGCSSPPNSSLYYGTCVWSVYAGEWGVKSRDGPDPNPSEFWRWAKSTPESRKWSRFITSWRQILVPNPCCINCEGLRARSNVLTWPSECAE